MMNKLLIIAGCAISLILASCSTSKTLTLEWTEAGKDCPQHWEYIKWYHNC